MGVIPSGTKIATIGPNVNVKERKDSVNNSKTEVYDIEDIVQTANGGKVYKALISQSGTSAPTVTVLQNTLGFTPTWSYEGVGTYRVNSVGNFGSRTYARINHNSVAFIGFDHQFGLTDDYIQLAARNSSGVAADNLLAKDVVEIQILD